MVFRSHSRAGRSEVTSAEIHPEKLVCAARTEPEMARPEVEFTPIAGSSPDRGISVTTDSPVIDSCGEAVEVLSEGPFPGRISNLHIQQNPCFTSPTVQPEFFISTDSLRLLVECCTRRINQAPSVVSLSLYFLSVSIVLVRVPIGLYYFVLFVCSVSWLFLIGCQY